MTVNSSLNHPFGLQQFDHGVGALIDFLFIRWLKRPSVLRLIVITIGVSILIRESMLHVWDEKVRTLRHFTGSEISSIKVLGAYISPQVLWVLGISAVIVVVLSLFFRLTLVGRAMRACSDNRTAARLCGIRASRMVTFAFMLSAGIGALAGCAISPLTHYGGRMRDFKQLKVWQKAHYLVLEIYRHTRGFPPEERFVLTAHLLKPPLLCRQTSPRAVVAKATKSSPGSSASQPAQPAKPSTSSCSPATSAISTTKAIRASTAC